MAMDTANFSGTPHTVTSRTNTVAVDTPKIPRKSWQRRKQARPGEIFQAALDVFSRKGFSASHMNEIAQQADITKGTIYLYYPDKEALFRTLVSEMIGKALTAAIDGAASSGTSAKDKLLTFVEAITELLTEHKRAVLFKIIIAESGNFPELARFYRTEIIDRITKALSDIVISGVQQGEFHQLPPDQVARLCLAPVIFAATWRSSFARPDEVDLGDWAAVSTQFKILLYGCLAKECAVEAIRDRSAA